MADVKEVMWSLTTFLSMLNINVSEAKQEDPKNKHEYNFYFNDNDKGFNNSHKFKLASVSKWAKS